MQKYVALALDTLAELCESGDEDMKKAAAGLILDYARDLNFGETSDEPL